MHMSAETEARYREAVELVNLSDLERWGSRAYRTLQAYKTGERRVTDEAARELVEYLRDRAGKLNEAAERLAAAMEKEVEG